MEVTSGVSLAKTGRSGSSRRTARTTSPAGSAWQANTRPRCSTLGHDRLTSTATMPARPRSRRATSRKSSTLLPAIETTTGTPLPCSHARSFASHRSTPGFCRPMAFSIPEAVSAMRGVGSPSRGSSVMDFTTMAPSSPMSKKRSISGPEAKQPDAVVIGLARVTPPRSTRRSTSPAGIPTSGPVATAGASTRRTSLIAHPTGRRRSGGPARAAARRRPARARVRRPSGRRPRPPSRR